MKKLLIPILALFLFVGFKATNPKTIKGIIVASENGLPLSGAEIRSLPSNKKAIADHAGKFSLQIPDNDTAIIVSHSGYEVQTIKLDQRNTLKIKLKSDQAALKEVTEIVYKVNTQKRAYAAASTNMLQGRVAGLSIMGNTESYTGIEENGFRKADKSPLSTFSIDVDAASYSNVRRFINNGGLPPKDAVRIEEMINYFDYEYEQPTGKDPVNITTEIAPAPWNPEHRLLHIGLQAKTIPTANLPAANLVFLIDVSGSMNATNKLPLLVSSLKLLTNQLREKDKVAIVVYAGNTGLVLPSTPGDHKAAIKDALNKLSTGGSTAGGAGLELAYKVALANFIKGGNNRVILATDGDFNVGASSDAAMQRLIEEQRKSGVFLTVLGYGMGNYKDSKMETLADKGNGNYAYIDNITEAKKVLINEFGGTLFTIAKDVKLQLEFNPAKVQAYRLIGYENRMLKSEDFNNDKKDAGELGSGHTVTALYEIIPVGVKSEFIGSVDELKYQKPAKTIKGGEELLTIKLRYKEPNGTTSKLLQQSIIDQSKWSKMMPTNNFKFAAAVAEFGMLLRQSEFKQNSSFGQVIELAQDALGKDKEGYRSEFLRLAKSTQLMAKDLLNIADRNGNEQAIGNEPK